MPYNDEEKDLAERSGTSRTSLSDLEECPLTGHETTYVPKKKSRRCTWPSNESPFWKFYSLFMTAISFVLIVVQIHDSTSTTSTIVKHVHHQEPSLSSHETTSLLTEGGHGHKEQDLPPKALWDYPSEQDRWRKENLVQTRFFRDTRYMTLDHSADYLWKEHLFMATGNIRVPSDDGKNASLMGISMFHQMHCLAKLRMALQMAKEGVDIGSDWTDDAHWPHCFDYMRSSIMCYADGTLESVSLQPGPVDDGTFVKIIDGGLETRYCRDTKPLYELERQFGPNGHYGHANGDEDFQVAPGKKA